MNDEELKQIQEALPKYVFWTAATLLVFVLSWLLLTSIQEKKEYNYWNEKAVKDNTPNLCENIKNLQLSARCYSQFITTGFDCTTQAQTSDACLVAQGVFLKNDTFCDAVFPEEKLPLNLECRVSVFIERYTNEGLSDCCHIK